MISVDYFNKAEEAVREYNRNFEDSYLEKAIEFYNQAIAKDYLYAEAYYRRAIVYGLLEDYDKKFEDLNTAIHVFEEVLKQDQANWELLFNLGMAYKDNYRLGDHTEKAWYYLSEAQKVNATNPRIVYELANLLKYDKREYSEALKYYSKAIELDSENSDFYLERGECYDSLKQYDNALNDYTKGISLKPYEWPLYNRRGELYIRIEEWAEAIEDYKKFRELYPYPKYFPLVELQRNINHGPNIELHFAVNTDKHESWHPDSWYLEDCIFTEFSRCFACPFEEFSIYGCFEYSPVDMEQLLNALTENLDDLNRITCYNDFLNHVIKTWFVSTLIRKFDDIEAHWNEWLEQLKRINVDLISLIGEALKCGEKLYLFGV